jgi:branched-chain amino acid transport system substrate-binding protein
MKSDDPSWLSRRDILKASGVSGAALMLAGCFESGSDGGDGGSDGGDGGSDGGDGGSDGGSDGGDGGSDGDDGGDGETGPLTIGMVNSLTGSLAPYGERNERGMQLALSSINEAGIGSDGSEFEILVEDSESTNQSGVNAARKLVTQNGVPLLVGAVGSGVSLAIHNSVTKDAGVVQISQNSTSPELSNEPALLRMSPSGAAKGKALAKLVGQDHDTVAVTWINNDYGSGLSGVFEESFDGTVAYNSPHDQGQASYRGVLSEMASTDATAWVFITYADEFTVMVNEGFDQGYNEQVEYYGAESTIADSILENTPEGSQESLVGITESAPVDQESYQTFKSEFESEFGDSPTVWSAYAYDAVTVSAIAVEAAGEFSSEAIAEVVRDVTRPEGETVYTFSDAKAILEDGGSPADINYEGVSGPVDLDENGDPPGFYQVYEVNDHSYEFGDFITG